MLHKFRLYYAHRKECFMLLQSFHSFFRANRFFIKPLSFVLFVICLLSLVVALTACHSKEKENAVSTKMEQPEISPIQLNFQDVTLSPASTAQSMYQNLPDNLDISEPDLPNEMVTMTDDVEEDLTIDPEKSIDKSHLHALLEHYAVNQFLPNGEESQDFQQAYLASIYTMRHNSPDIKTDDTADVAFIKSMIKHRQGVVWLANLQLKYGEDDSLKVFAKDMIASQENEIWLMEHWLKEVYPTLPKTNQPLVPTYQMMEQEYHNSINQMHEQMLVGALQEDADMAFIQTMLPLLKGGLVLAQVALKYGNEPKVQSIANNIIMNQIPEIKALQKWRKEHR